MLNVPIAVFPCDLFVHHSDRFNVIRLPAAGFDISHPGQNRNNLNALKEHIKILLFLAGIVDAVPFNFRGCQRLTLGNGLKQIGAG